MIRKTVTALSFFIPFLIVLCVGIKAGLDFDSESWLVRGGSFLWFLFSGFVGYSTGKTLDEMMSENKR